MRNEAGPRLRKPAMNTFGLAAAMTVAFMSVGSARTSDHPVSVERQINAGLRHNFNLGRKMVAACRPYVADIGAYVHCKYQAVNMRDGHRVTSVPREILAGADYQNFYDVVTSLGLKTAQLATVLWPIRDEIVEMPNGDVHRYCTFWKLHCSLLKAAFDQEEVKRFFASIGTAKKERSVAASTSGTQATPAPPH